MVRPERLGRFLEPDRLEIGRAEHHRRGLVHAPVAKAACRLAVDDDLIGGLEGHHGTRVHALRALLAVPGIGLARIDGAGDAGEEETEVVIEIEISRAQRQIEPRQNRIRRLAKKGELPLDNIDGPVERRIRHRCAVHRL